MEHHWINEYKNLLLSENIEKAKDIKNNYTNRNFYKYRCFDDKGFWLDWVKGGLYANSPNSFNDPFDCMLTITPEAYEKLLRNELMTYFSRIIKLTKLDKNRLEFSDKPIDAFKNIYEQRFGVKFTDELSDMNFKKSWDDNIEKWQPKFKDSFKVICFSEKHDSILMWSHYTNNHQGFCIEYSFNDNSEISNNLYPVVYSEELPILSQMHFINKKPSVLIISCKAPEWRYEQEWRYLHVMNPMSQDKSNNPLKLTALNAVKAIYLGVEAKKYNEQYVNELVDVARNLGIQLYEMKFSENEYRLIPHRIEIT